MKRVKLLAGILGIILLCTGALSGCKMEIGTFYTLQEAYDTGYLTKEDVMSIAYYHNGGRVYNEDIMNEDYTPIPKAPQELSENVSYKIRETVALDLRHSGIKNAEADGVNIVHYYGTYEDAVAVIVKHSYFGDNGDEAIDISDTIADVIFHYWTHNQIQIWIES